MKLPLLASSLLFLVTVPAFAQPPPSQPPSSDSAPAAAELSRLRESYVASLKLLLEQYVKAQKVEEAAAVIHEIDKVEKASVVAAPAGSPDALTSPCGNWIWQNNSGTKAIHADGTVGQDLQQGTWHWIDQPNRKLQIDWTDGFIDKLTLSKDGKTMRVINNIDDEYTVRRLPPKNENEPPENP